MEQENFRTVRECLNGLDFQPDAEAGNEALTAIEQRCTAMARALDELALYFTRENDVPVERVTIMSKDFWRITGMVPPALDVSRKTAE